MELKSKVSLLCQTRKRGDRLGYNEGWQRRGETTGGGNVINLYCSRPSRTHLPWWSTDGEEAWRILGMEKPMSSSVRVSSFITYGS